MNATDWLETQVLNSILRGVAFGPIGAHQHLALFCGVGGLETGAPTQEVDTGGGSGYARLTVVNADWAVPSSPAGSITNANPLSFAAATADWCDVSNPGVQAPVSHWGLYDTGNTNLMIWGTLTANIDVLNGDTFRFLAGQLVIYCA